MPQWAGSCWYYLRYSDPKNAERLVGEAAERTGWTGVDLYVGGAEHAVLHLLYARFWHKVLSTWATSARPSRSGRLFHQGMITSFAYQRDDKTLVAGRSGASRDKRRASRRDSRRGKRAHRRSRRRCSKSLQERHQPGRRRRASTGPTRSGCTRCTWARSRRASPGTRGTSSACTGSCSARGVCSWTRRPASSGCGPSPTLSVEKLLHRTIAKVQADIERLAFNTAIAALISWSTRPARRWSDPRSADRFCACLRRSRRTWPRSCGRSSGALVPSRRRWPTYDPAKLVDASVEMPARDQG